MFVLNITSKIEKVLIQCPVWLPVHVLRKFGGWAQLWVCIQKEPWWTGAAVAAAGWSHGTNSAFTNSLHQLVRLIIFKKYDFILFRTSKLFVVFEIFII